MSEEISRQIEAAAAARSREAASRVDPSHLADFIVAGATRRRRVRALATAAFAVVGVLVLAGGTVAAVGAWGPDAVAPATQSATPTSSETAEASTSPSPSPTATAPAADVGLDGIANYPALAPSRGEGFPTAHVMEDWVWDHVGPGWSLESYSMAWDPYTEPSPEIPNAVVYLVSPDGATFELVTFDHPRSAGLKVVSWREDERKALVWWEGNGVDEGDAAELDLQTGVLDPLDFTMPGKVHSMYEQPVAVSSDGTELWVAWRDGVGQRYYRWSFAEGWTAASINDLAGLGTLSGFNVLSQLGPSERAYVRADGGAVALGRFKDGDDSYGGASPVEIAIYDLERDVVTLTEVAPGFPGEVFVGWSAQNALEYEVYNGDGSGLPSASVGLVVNGAPAMGPAPKEFSFPLRGQTGRSAVVGFREATANGILYRECGC